MTKTEAKEIAKELMLNAIGIAYYTVCDGDDYDHDEQQLIIDYMNKYGERMAKAINGKFITY